MNYVDRKPNPEGMTPTHPDFDPFAPNAKPEQFAQWMDARHEAEAESSRKAILVKKAEQKTAAEAKTAFIARLRAGELSDAEKNELIASLVEEVASLRHRLDAAGPALSAAQRHVPIGGGRF